MNPLPALLFSSTLAIAAMLSLTPGAFAQDTTGPNAGPAAEGSTPGGASTMGLAQRLYAAGVAQGDAVTVLAAAKLAASVEVKDGNPVNEDQDAEAKAALQSNAVVFATSKEPLSRKVERRLKAAAQAKDVGISLATIGEAPAEDDEGAAEGPVTADAMFAKASELATGDAALLGVIEDAKAESSRGRIGGAVQWLSRLPAGQTDVWEIPFYGNSYAEIAVLGDGDADLDVAITDENGNVFCYDVSWSDSLYCDFTPAWDGYFYVTVQNMGRVRNSYYLMTN